MSVIWTSPDGLWGVIKAKDLPLGVARSKTRDDPTAAETAPWDPGLLAPVGPGSLNKYVKVRLSDLPNQLGGTTRPTIVLRPGDYANGSVTKRGKFIPEFPHTCPLCGGKMLVLFSSTEHEGGVCPGPPKAMDVYLSKRKKGRP